METFAIFRRNLATTDDIEEVDRRSQAELDRRSDEVRKIRSYLFEEEDGSLGAICVYEAQSPEAVVSHGECADVKVDEVRRLTAIDVHRPDPTTLTAG
ncbi:MAG: nickel-binding protein [Acidimicrobiales bacterium]